MVEPRTESMSARAIRAAVTEALQPVVVGTAIATAPDIARRFAGWPDERIERPNITMPTASPEPRAGSQTTYTVNELAGHHDRAFVVAAYLAILGRRPDPTGLDHHLALLRGGMSKVEILGRLRYSVEGKRVDTVVPGLRPRFVLALLGDLPVVGALVMLLEALARGAATRRGVRRLEAHITQLHAAHTQQLIELERVTDRNLRLLEERIAILRGG